MLKKQPKKNTLDRMKILTPVEYAELRLMKALSEEPFQDSSSIFKILDIEKQEAIGFLMSDRDGIQIAIVKENSWNV